jgi:hypothetical protein
VSSLAWSRSEETEQPKNKMRRSVFLFVRLIVCCGLKVSRGVESQLDPELFADKKMLDKVPVQFRRNR